MSIKLGADGTNLEKFAEALIVAKPHKVEPTSRRIRIIHNHAVIMDTVNAVHVWEHPYYPQLYVPLEEILHCCYDVRSVLRVQNEARALFTDLVTEGGRGYPAATNERVIIFPDLTGDGRFTDLMRIEFGSVDQWLEEDTPIYVHPKDPYKRIDILQSSRPVRVQIGDDIIAESSHSAHLLETLLPTRYYLPLAAVDQSKLRKSPTITKCPYKGEAEYYDVVVGGKVYKDVVWYYRLPTHESAMITGLVCFYNEKVDIFLDGKKLPQPETVFA